MGKNKFWDIIFKIKTNMFWNQDKYISQSRQIHFKINTKTFKQIFGALGMILVVSKLNFASWQRPIQNSNGKKKFDIAFSKSRQIHFKIKTNTLCKFGNQLPICRLWQIDQDSAERSTWLLHSPQIQVKTFHNFDTN